MKKYILIILAILPAFIPILAQMNETDTVKKYYPEVYVSIENLATELYADNPNLVKQVINGHSKAFLGIAETTEPIDENAMTNSILRYSLKGQYAYNKQIIGDLSIENPFPYLRCNWYMVRKEYEETKNIIDNGENSPMHLYYPDKNPYSGYEVPDLEDSKRKEQKKKIGPDKKKNKFRKGIKFNIGTTYYTDSEMKREASSGIKYSSNIDVGYVFNFQEKGGFFHQYEITIFSIDFMKVNDMYYSESFTLYRMGGKISAIAGFYHQFSPKIKLTGSAGLFGSYHSSAEKNDYDTDYYPDSDNLAALNYGIAVSFGLESKESQFTIAFNIGLNDLSKDKFDLRSRSLQLSYAFIF